MIYFLWQLKFLYESSVLYLKLLSDISAEHKSVSAC